MRPNTPNQRSHVYLRVAVGEFFTYVFVVMIPTFPHGRVELYLRIFTPRSEDENLNSSVS